MSHTTECTKIQEDLSALMDGELSEVDSQAAYDHIETCAECRDLYTAFTQMDALFAAHSSEPELAVPEWNALEKQLAPPRPQPGKVLRFVWYAAACAFVFSLAVALILRATKEPTAVPGTAPGSSPTMAYAAISPEDEILGATLIEALATENDEPHATFEDVLAQHVFDTLITGAIE